MKIKDGAATSNIRGKKIEEIKFLYEGDKIQLWVNDSLTYLTIQEAFELKENLKQELINASKNSIRLLKPKLF
jgi:hypothetical protein